ncbi:hypothetical protein CMV_025291 [Castanea mollissima]|uniref:DUF4283 domain-containing protein n=1 Tax=Castanea mollissima TaxID=60419 RepID=A0A8J4VH27_9ROSI|nr:hypothetical protein CMV_025291 [Castanea mollissima]
MEQSQTKETAFGNEILGKYESKETVYGEEEREQDENGNTNTVDTETRCNNIDQLREEDQLNEESWEINVSVELKWKMAGPWQTSIMLKLMGKQLGYRALQTRLAGIWSPSGNMVLVDIGYGYFIMKFDTLKDYN